MEIQELLIRAVTLLNKCSIPMRDARLAAQAYELIDRAGQLAVKPVTPKKEENHA